MKFSIQLLLGFLLCSGVFFVNHTEANVLKEKSQTLQEELKKEVREHVMIPCRKAIFKKFPFIFKDDEILRRVLKRLEEIENMTLDVALTRRSLAFDEDLRMTLYLNDLDKCVKLYHSVLD